MEKQTRSVPVFVQNLQTKYQDGRNTYQKWHYRSQIAIIVLSGITPVLLLIPQIPKAVSGLSAAMASAIAGAANTLNFREKYGLNKVNFERISLEIAKYQEKALVYKSDDDAEDKLFEEISKIHLNRLEKWQHEFIDDRDDTIVSSKEEDIK